MTLHPSDLLGKDLEFSARRLTVVAYDPAKGWKLVGRGGVRLPDHDGAPAFTALTPCWLPTEALSRLLYEGVLVAA